MSLRKKIYLFVNLLLTVALSVNAQQLQKFSSPNQQRIDSLRNVPIKIITSDYYTHNLAFFCKKELQLEKITKVPFRFRLGNIDYVDYLEGKSKAPKQ